MSVLDDYVRATVRSVLSVLRPRVNWGGTGTAAGTATAGAYAMEYTVTTDGRPELRAGCMVAVTFAVTNGAGATINVNDLGHLPICYRGAPVTKGRIPPGSNALLLYDTETIPGGCWSVYSCDRAAILDAHPVGSYYWSDAPTSPATLFGGSWVPVKDVFVLAAGDTYAAGATGGEATHKLTVGELPSHTHPVGVQPNGTLSGAGLSYAINDQRRMYTGEIAGKAGGDRAHNNMPPYMTAYCWRRTA